jgi:hypothetical protein
MEQWPNQGADSTSGFQLPDRPPATGALSTSPTLGIPATHPRPHVRNRNPRIKKPSQAKCLPELLSGTGPESNERFEEAMADPVQSISPRMLGFMPSSYWLNTSISFGDLVIKFFHRKNNSACRFPHKLYNALTLVENTPCMFALVGVRWITDTAFLVDKLIFGRLLGIQSFDGGLFHRQGNFPSHGFRSLHPDQLAAIQSPGFDSNMVDYDRYRVMEHSTGLFKRAVSDDFFETCKWTEL